MEEYIVNALKNREEEIFLTQYEIDADRFFEYYYRILNKHVGWNSPFEADDDSFEHALWTTSAGSVVYQDGYWYYVNQAQNQLFKTKDILDGSTESLYTFDLWMATLNTNWVGAFSYPQKSRNKLICIIFSVFGWKGTIWNICSIRLLIWIVT